MDIYDGSQLVLLVDGGTPECLTDVSLGEALELLPSQNDPQGWQALRPNNQTFQISFSGDDEGGFSFLRGLKRSLTLVAWSLNTDDGLRQNSGEGYITEVTRSSDADNFETFTATLIGYGAIV